MNAVPAVAFDLNGTLSRDEPMLSDVDRELFSARRDSAAWPSSALTGPSGFAQPTEIVEAIDVGVVARPAPVRLV